MGTSKIFFTSDTHFGHENIIEYDKRPFKDADEMDKCLIDNWNSKVKMKNTQIYHLGDFAYKSRYAIEYYLNRLYGQVHIIFGNHDDKGARRFKDLFLTAQEMAYISINDQRMTLYHYAQRTWRNSHYGSWQLFGHSHGRMDPWGKSFDVGVTPNNYTPLSFEEVEAKMATLPTVAESHRTRCLLTRKEEEET